MRTGGIDLSWLPLGAGGQSVRWNGRLYEAVCALREHRARGELFHSALEVTVDGDTWVIEMTPAGSVSGRSDRGVQAEGCVGAGWAGRSRLFRYEVHAWRGGTIADVAEAVASPVHLTSDAATSRRLLALLPCMPTPVWGRDALRAGEMWNSNSVVSWALARSGLDAAAISPPLGGRAPGWSAGIVAASRDRAEEPRGAH